MSEDDLIARHFAPLAGEDGLGLLDDAARIASIPGHDLIITCDALVAGVHFFADDPADSIAAKALRVNLSDLAAKGAIPRGFVLALALPKQDEAWLTSFARGLKRDIDAFAFPLLGGDTVKTPGPLMVSVTALVQCHKAAWCRAPARALAMRSMSPEPSAMPRSGFWSVRARFLPDRVEHIWCRAISCPSRAML